MPIELERLQVIADAFQITKEPLINSGSFSCAGKMRQIKAPIAGNSQPIAKIGNAELAHFNKQMLIHELIRGSLILLFLYTSVAEAELYTRVAETESTGVALDIASYDSDWQFDSGVREARITSISFQIEEKLEAGLIVGGGIGYFDMNVRSNSNVSAQDFDGQYLEIYLHHPFPVSERISIHGAFAYRYYSGDGNNRDERADIDWNEVNLQIGVGVRFAHLRITPFAAYYNIDGDISDDSSTGSFENDDSVSQGVSLDYFVDDTAFIRLEFRSGYQAGGRISFERRY